MLKSHERFHSANGKRLILVADDEQVNREILKETLQDDYELVFAADGKETLEKIRANRQTLSLVLLDLMMPEMSGLEVLRQMREDSLTSLIPVIVLTSDAQAEVESLTLGAIDFIPKPYPQAGVIHARILRTIELFEDRQIINSTERDAVTGLYNREYFYRYAEQYDRHHASTPMDAIVFDVNHFHMVNERFGTARGDRLLKRVASVLRSLVTEAGGIVCRREADTFMVYCPHGADPAALLEAATAELAADEGDGGRIWLRMGVYADADKSIEVERRFDRAKLAADNVRGSFTQRIAFYDEELHERELYDEQLVEDFPAALEQGQFIVFYQPKYDIREEAPVLASAEALVRWKHPELGMVPPGSFIPLFEDNGLIQALDEHVWRTAAAQVGDWKRRLGFSVPVSVNMSRVEMYDPDLVQTLTGILAENGVTTDDIFLEITESAYTEDSRQIVDMVNELRERGFHIEMDDFGTGYSSLNMVSTLPIDALKLDMQFMRTAFEENPDTKMIEIVIDIADYLGVPVIAEGVETKEQMEALKAMDCEYVQGYYLSRPVPPYEYEKLVAERRDRNIAPGKARNQARKGAAL